MADVPGAPLRLDPAGAIPRATMAAVVVHAGVAYASGVVPTDADGRLIGEGDPEAQARACIDTIERVLAAAGATLDDILRCTCFATSPEAARAYIKVRAERIACRPAATTLLATASLVPGAMMEIEVIARIPPPAGQPGDTSGP